MHIEIHPEASNELEYAKLWYENQSGGLGDEFLDEIDRAIDKIEQWPEAWTPYWQDVRRILVHRFPYVIYYRCSTSAPQTRLLEKPNFLVYNSRFTFHALRNAKNQSTKNSQQHL